MYFLIPIASIHFSFIHGYNKTEKINTLFNLLPLKETIEETEEDNELMASQVDEEGKERDKERDTEEFILHTQDQQA